MEKRTKNGQSNYQIGPPRVVGSSPRSRYHVPRHCFAGPTSEITLLVFSDESYAAPASVAYLVYTTESDTKPKVTFALGKA